VELGAPCRLEWTSSTTQLRLVYRNPGDDARLPGFTDRPTKEPAQLVVTTTASSGQRGIPRPIANPCWISTPIERHSIGDRAAEFMRAGWFPHHLGAGPVTGIAPLSLG
jgi:hypothetical protein